MLGKAPDIVAASLNKPLYSLVPSTLSGTPRSFDCSIASGNSDACSSSLVFMGQKSKRSAPSTDLADTAGELLTSKTQRASKRRSPPPALFPLPQSPSIRSLPQRNVDAISSINTVPNLPFAAEAEPSCLQGPLSTLALSSLPSSSYPSSSSSSSPSSSSPRIDTGATDAGKIVLTPKPLQAKMGACKPPFGEVPEPAAPLTFTTHASRASSLSLTKRSSTSSTSSVSSSSSSSSSSLTTKPILFINNIAPNIPRPKPTAGAYVQTQSAIQQKARKQLREEGKIKRSSNCFIMYRTHMHPFIVARYGNQNNKEISRLAGRCWRNEPEAVKAIYRQQAQMEKQKHAVLYPSYKYTPARSCQLKGNSSSATSTSRGATKAPCVSETDNCQPVDPENTSNQGDTPTRKQMSSSQRSKNSLTSSAHKAAERQFTVTETPLHDFMGDSDLTIQKPHGSKNRPHRPPRRRSTGNSSASSSNNIISRARKNNLSSDSASTVSIDVSLSMNSLSFSQSSGTSATPLPPSLGKQVPHQILDGTVMETSDAPMTLSPIIIGSVPHDSPLSLPLCLTNNSNEKTNTTGSSTWSDIPSEFPEPLTKESWSTLASSQGFGAAHETSDPMATLIHAPMNFQLTTTGGNICDIYEHELKFVDEPTFYLNYSRSQMVNIHNWASQHFSLRGQECPVLSEWEAQAMDPQKTSSSGPSYNSIQEATVVSNDHYQGFPWQHLSTVSEPSSTLDFLYDDLIVGAMTEPGMASPASMPESTPPSTADASPMQSVHSPTHDVSAIIATSCMQTLITAAPSLKIPVVPVHTHGEFVPQTTTTALAPVDTKVIDAMDVSRLYHERKGAQNGEWTTKGSTNPLLMSEVWPTCHLSMLSLEMFPLSNQSLYTLSSSVSSSTDLSSSASMRTNYPSTPPEHGTTNYEFTELRVAAATTDHTMEWTVPGSAPVVMSNSNSNSNGNGNGTSSSNSSYDKAPWITHIPLQDRDAVFDSNVYTCSDEELSRSIQYYEQLVEQKKMRLSLQRHWKLQQQQLLQQQQQQQQL